MPRTLKLHRLAQIITFLLIAAVLLIVAGVAGRSVLAAGTPLTEIKKIVAPDGVANDRFGYSIAIDGDYLVVSSPGDGSVYVFGRNVNGPDNWGLVVKLKPLNPDQGFGDSIDISGTTVVVGGLSVSAPAYAGTAYLFDVTCTPVAGICNEVRTLLPSTRAANSFFGQDVAISGTTVVIGSQLDGTTLQSGAAYVFDTGCTPVSGNICNETKRLVPPTLNLTDYFGVPVSIDGSTIVVAAPGDNTGGVSGGAAYIFDAACVPSGGVCTPSKKLLASDRQAADQFGYSAIDGSTIVIGAATSESTRVGAAYIFDAGCTPTAGVCNEQKKLVATGVAPRDEFGIPLGIEGDLITVSASEFAYYGGDNGPGSVFTFDATCTPVSGVCNQNQKLVASDAATGDSFGAPDQTDISNGIVAVPAFQDDDNGTDSGSVYLFGPALFPAAPSGLMATAIYDTQVNLSWTDNSSDETGFRIERSDNGGSSWSIVTTTSSNATSYYDTDVIASTAYSYRVIAVNSMLSLESALSNTLNVTTSAPMFVVNTTNDVDDGTCNPTHCSLREAINATNVHAGADTIAFNIPGGGVQTINVASALPTVTGPVTIDGLTQPGASCAAWPATLNIEISGPGWPADLIDPFYGYISSDGLQLTGGSSTVRGLVINGFKFGITLNGAGGNTVSCNYIGTNANGTTTKNNLIGIYANNVANNVIGTSGGYKGNLISGNLSQGILLTGAGATGNQVVGNRIGTNAAGDSALGNSDWVHTGGSALALRWYASGNTIGGASPELGNLISGNTSAIPNTVFGIEIFYSTNNTIIGNKIGLNLAGTSAVPNGYGVVIQQANDNVVGGSATGERNIISGNKYGGVSITGNGNQIKGNYLGTDLTGTLAIGNGIGTVSGPGGAVIIGIGSNNQVGGSLAGEGNLISGNNHGVVVVENTTTTTIQGNIIGTTPDGNTALPNAKGILIQAKPANANTQILNNQISGNTVYGIYLENSSGSSTLADNTLIQDNKIGTNAAGSAAIPNGTDAGVNGGISVYGGLQGTQITGNLIAFNGTDAGDYGVYTSNSTLGTSANNCLYGNGTGFFNNTATALSFASNWWGSATGPTVASNPWGTGQTITGTGAANVTYSPFLTTAPAFCAGLPTYPPPTWTEGKALYAIGSCMSPYPAIEMSGSAFTVNGGMFSNGDIDINPGGGPSTTVNGGAGAVGVVDGHGKVTFNPPEENGQPPQTPPALWNIADFRPGGLYANAASTEGAYFNVSTGTWPAKVNGRLPAGIYYSSGDMSLNGTIVGTNPGNITFVAEGRITVSVAAPESGWFPYVIPSLSEYRMPLMFSSYDGGSCTGSTANAAIKRTGAYTFDGVLYAPTGMIVLSYSSASISTGAVVGWQILTSGSDFVMNYDPDQLGIGPAQLVKPNFLNAVAAGSSQINLTWADNSSDETEFRIERSPDGISGWTEIATVGANSTAYSDIGLTSGTPYYYRVRAYRSGDEVYSNYSNVASATTPIFADVAVVKTAFSPDDDYRIGTYFNYIITVTNNGPDVARNVIVADDLPVAYVSYSLGNYSCVPAVCTNLDPTNNSKITLNVGTVNPGGNVVVTVLVLAVQSGQVSNTATVTTDSTDLNSVNNSSTNTTRIFPAAVDVAISKAASVSGNVPFDTMFSYTIVVNAPDYAANVVVTDTLPSGLAYISASPAPTSSPPVGSGGTVTWALGTVSPGTRTITLTVQAISAGTVSNTASVATSLSDPDLLNNIVTTPSITILPPMAGVRIAKSVNVTVTHIGAPVTYTLIADNIGPNTAQSVVITDVLPAGMYFISSSPSPTTNTLNGDGTRILTWSIGALAKNSTQTVMVMAAATSMGDFVNTASVSSVTADPDPSDNTANAVIAVESSPGAPPSVTLVSPANAAFVATSTPELSWNTTLYGASYRVQVSKRSDFATIEVDSTVVTLYLTTPSLPDGLHYWRVRGVNELGQVGAWSAARYFTIDTIAPVAPALYTPADGAKVTVTKPTLKVLAVSGAKYYHFQVSLTDDFVSPVFDKTVTTTSVATTPLPDFGAYYWRVQAQDVAGNVSGWSVTRSFVFTVMKAPMNGAYITTTQKPTFSWTSLTGATGWTLEVYKDSSLSTLAFPAKTLSGSVLSTASPVTLSYGTYYWRLKVTGTGLPGNWMPTWSFIVSPTPLAAPLLADPANGKPLSDNTPDLKWNPVAGAASYDIQIDNSSGFSLPIIQTSSTLATTYTASSLSDGLYYWRVRTVNSYGAPGPWSAARYFTIDTVAPAAPALYSPADGAKVTVTKPTLKVLAVSGAKYYHFQVSLTDDFVSPVFDKTVTTTSVTLDTPLPDFGAYYWRVQAQDAAGNASGWSVTRSFVFTVMKAPMNGAYITTTQKPTFSWTSLTGATGWTLEVASDSDFSSLVFIPSPSLGASVLSYTPTTALSYGTYYWRLKVTGAGLPTNAMPVWSFIVSPTPLAAPLLADPANGKPLSDNTPDLKWNPVAGAASYDIQIDNSSGFSLPIIQTSSTSATTYTASSLSDGLYYWRVRTVNSYGAPGPWSAARYFTIDTVAPAAPVLYSPADKAYTTDTTPTFTTLAVKGAIHYRFEVASDSAFTMMIDVATLSTTSYTRLTPYADGLKYWRVIAIDAAGNGSPPSISRTLTIN